MPDPAENTLSPNEVGSILGLTGEAVKQWIYHRHLPATKLVNGYWKVKKSDLERFIQDRIRLPKRIVLTYGAGNFNFVPDEDLRIEYVSANGSVDALLKARRMQPVAAIIDCSTVDGWAVVKKLRGSANTRKVPILILMDSELSQVDLDQVLDLNLQGCLPKPFNMEMIAREIEILLKQG